MQCTPVMVYDNTITHAVSIMNVKRLITETYSNYNFIPKKETVTEKTSGLFFNLYRWDLF